MLDSLRPQVPFISTSFLATHCWNSFVPWLQVTPAYRLPPGWYGGHHYRTDLG